MWHMKITIVYMQPTLFVIKGSQDVTEYSLYICIEYSVYTVKDQPSLVAQVYRLCAWHDVINTYTCIT